MYRWLKYIIIYKIHIQLNPLEFDKKYINKFTYHKSFFFYRLLSLRYKLYIFKLINSFTLNLNLLILL